MGDFLKGWLKSDAARRDSMVKLAGFQAYDHNE